MSNAAFAVNCNNDIEMSRRVPQMVSLKDAAERTGLSERYLRNAFINGQLVGIRCGGNSRNGKILLNFDKLIDYLNEHTEQTAPEPEYQYGGIRPVKI
ncbi:MAG: hypothetical protein ACI4JK_04900 [Oscillospiraceae bacterium]